HLSIRSGRQIGAAERRVCFTVGARSGDFQPIGILFQSCKESGEPAVLVAMFMRSRPDTELFHVIAHGSDATGVDSGRIAQISNDLLNFAEGNEIAESFLPRIEPHGLATGFGDISARKLLRL